MNHEFVLSNLGAITDTDQASLTPVTMSQQQNPAQISLSADRNVISPPSSTFNTDLTSSFNQEQYARNTKSNQSQSTPNISGRHRKIHAFTSIKSPYQQQLPSSSSPQSASSYSKMFLPKDLRYSCDMCQKKFDRPSSLRQHLRSHTGERPFVCCHNNCGRSFSILSNLRRHYRVHGLTAAEIEGVTTATTHSGELADLEQDALRGLTSMNNANYNYN
jgi:uncharacterized Zn-finger protein